MWGMSDFEMDGDKNEDDILKKIHSEDKVIMIRTTCYRKSTRPDLNYS